MTAGASPQDRARCLAAGMDDYISKPVTAGELQFALQRSDVIRQDEAKAAQAEQAAPAAVPNTASDNDPDPQQAKDLDLKILEQLYRFKPAAIRELISTFIEHAGSQIADLERAMSQEDTEAISALAHSLKGSSGTIGASRMSDLCASLERQARETEMPTAVQDIADLAAEFDRVSGILESRLETWPAPGDATSKAAS